MVEYLLVLRLNVLLPYFYLVIFFKDMNTGNKVSKSHLFRANTFFSVMAQDLAQEFIPSRSRARSSTEDSMTVISIDPFGASTLLTPLHWGWDWTVLSSTDGKATRV